jgi:16S rRNA (guanine966-N2)-methyltransferase
MCKIWRRDATKLGSCAPQSPFDLVFIDPPYGKGLGEQAMASLLEGDWLSAGAVLVLEESEKSAVGDVAGVSLTDTRSYGDTQVRVYRTV